MSVEDRMRPMSAARRQSIEAKVGATVSRSQSARGSVVVVVLLLEAEAFRTARTEAGPLLPPLIPNASTEPYRKPTYPAPDGPEMLDVEDQKSPEPVQMQLVAWQ